MDQGKGNQDWQGEKWVNKLSVRDVRQWEIWGRETLKKRGKGSGRDRYWDLHVPYWKVAICNCVLFKNVNLCHPWVSLRKKRPGSFLCTFILKISAAGVRSLLLLPSWALCSGVSQAFLSSLPMPPLAFELAALSGRTSPHPPFSTFAPQFFLCQFYLFLVSLKQSFEVVLPAKPAYLTKMSSPW